MTTHVIHGSAHQAVKQVMLDAGANLVVIGSHGESGFRHATIGSMAIALLETTRVDTLMVRTKDQVGLRRGRVPSSRASRSSTEPSTRCTVSLSSARRRAARRASASGSVTMRKHSSSSAL